MSYRTRADMINSFKSLEQTYPTLVHSESIGKTYLNNDILAFRIGARTGGKVIFNCTIHGREMVSAEVLLNYAKWLVQKKESVAKRILAYNQTIIIPIFNYDSYNIQRKNMNKVSSTGIDLNRNFEAGWGNGGSNIPTQYDYRGVSALSEPESKSLHGFISREKPVWFIDMHSGNYWVQRQDTAYATNYARVTSVIARFQQLWTSRGVQGTSYNTTETSPVGYAFDCANAHGACSLLWEFHPTENTTTIPDPPFSDVEPIWFPRFLPMAIAVSEDSEVTPPPPINGGKVGLILLTIFSLATLGLAIKKRR